MRLLLGAVAMATAGLPSFADAQSVSNPIAVTPFVLGQAGYAQNFDTLASSGSTGSTLPAGFQIVENGSNANGTYAVGTGSSNAGGSYSFGGSGSVDRALGSLGSGSVSPIYYGDLLSNGVGSAITALLFAFTGEQWRLTNAVGDGLTFQYRVGGTGVGGTTGWTTVDNLFFAPRSDGTAAGAAIDGNAPSNRQRLAATISGLSLGVGQDFAFRWVDVDTAGADQGLGVDDLRIDAVTAATTPAVPEPASWTMLMAGMGVIGGTMRRRSARRAVAAA